MPEIENVAQEALEGLNDEDKKILEDLQKEGHDVKGLTPEAKEPEKEPEKEPSKEPEDSKGKESEPEKGKDEKDKKEPSLMPRFEHAIAEKRWEKREADLLSKIEELQSGVDKGKPASETAQTIDDIEELAKELGADPDALRKIINKAASKAQSEFTLPAELQELLKDAKDIPQVVSTYKETIATQRFNEEFDAQVKPLVVKEFPDVSEKELSAIREKLKEFAVTEEYQRTGLNKIYKAEDDFRNIVSPKRKSAEGGNNGRNITVDLESLSAEDAENLPPEDFVKWSDLQAEKAKSK